METNREILEKYISDSSISTIHMWNDGWEGWNDLYSAIKEMQNYIEKSHALVYEKEKFGSYRFDILVMYDGTLKSWLQPTVRADFDWRFTSFWLYSHFPRVENFLSNLLEPPVNLFLQWFSKVDRFFAKFVPKKFIKWVNSWQYQKLNEGFQKVALKYPRIVNELISDVDMYKKIKPFGNYIIDGETIHNKYWKKI